MDQLRYNEEKAKLSYVYANSTALQRFAEARPFINVGHSHEAVEHAILATSAFLAAGPEGTWRPLAVAVAFTLVAYELDVGTYEPNGAYGLRLLAECEASLKSYGELCVRGERKYARGNYRLGAPITQYADCALRHLNAALRDEHLDPEMQVPHVTCGLWNLWQALDQPEWRDNRLPGVQTRPTLAEAYASPARLPEPGVIYAN